MYTFFPTNRFNKSFEKVRKHKKYRESEFITVLNTLLAGERLPKKFKEHKLSGEYDGCYECHVQNDVLFIYYFDDEKHILYAIDIGTHSELF